MKNKALEEKFLSSILSNTLSGKLEWVLVKNIFSSEVSHSYECKLGDDTTVKIKVELDENLAYKRCVILTIFNSKLTGGTEYCFTSDNDKVDKISEQIFLKYLKPNMPKKLVTQDSIFEDILKTIPGSVEENRDEKINEIIGTPKKKWSLF